MLQLYLQLFTSLVLFVFFIFLKISILIFYSGVSLYFNLNNNFIQNIDSKLDYIKNKMSHIYNIVHCLKFMFNFVIYEFLYFLKEIFIKVGLYFFFNFVLKIPEMHNFYKFFIRNVNLMVYSDGILNFYVLFFSIIYGVFILFSEYLCIMLLPFGNTFSHLPNMVCMFCQCLCMISY